MTLTEPVIIGLSALYLTQIFVMLLGKRWATGRTSFFLYYLLGSLLSLAAFYGGLLAAPSILS